ASLITGPARAQPHVISDLTTAQIVAAIGSEGDARRVVTLVIHGAIPAGDAIPAGEKRVFFLARQILAGWMPNPTQIELIRLDDPDVERHLAACGKYWIVGDVKRDGNVVSLMLGQRCGGRGLGYVVSFEDGDWHLGPPGTGRNGRGWGPGI